MITDSNGTPFSNTANALAEPQPQKRRDYKPAPGRVTVLRERVSEHFNEELDIAKPVTSVERDRAFAIFATVARIGDQIPGTMPCWFKVGDVVSVLISLFDEIELASGLSVWCGPWSGCTGKFEDATEEA